MFHDKKFTFFQKVAILQSLQPLPFCVALSKSLAVCALISTAVLYITYSYSMAFGAKVLEKAWPLFFLELLKIM